MSLVATVGNFEIRDADGAGMPPYYLIDRRTDHLVKDNDGMLTFATEDQARAWIEHFGGGKREDTP